MLGAPENLESMISDQDVPSFGVLKISSFVTSPGNINQDRSLDPGW